MRPPNSKAVERLGKQALAFYGPRMQLFPIVHSYVKESTVAKLLMTINSLMNQNYKMPTLILMAEMLYYMRHWMMELLKNPELPEDLYEWTENFGAGMEVLSPNREQIMAYSVITEELDLMLQEYLKDPEVDAELQLQAQAVAARRAEYSRRVKEEGMLAAAQWLDVQPRDMEEQLVQQYNVKLEPPISDADWESHFSQI